MGTPDPLPSAPLRRDRKSPPPRLGALLLVGETACDPENTGASFRDGEYDLDRETTSAFLLIRLELESSIGAMQCLFVRLALLPAVHPHGQTDPFSNDFQRQAL